MSTRLLLTAFGVGTTSRRGALALCRYSSVAMLPTAASGTKARRFASAVAVGASVGAAAAASTVESAPDKAAGKGMRVRIATYNVLSSQLAEPGYFNKCAPEDLEPATRLARILIKLESQVAAGAVIALQEVPREWTGPLHIFFKKHGYELTTSLYGRQFNGYMGVAMAWPSKGYETLQIDATRAGEFLPPVERRPYVKKPPPSSWPRLAAVTGSLRQLMKAIFSAPPQEAPFDEWNEAERRHNVVLSVKLKAPSGQSFGVSCYHMPCLFGSVEKERVMVIHAALAAKIAEKAAGGAPYVLAGDFNIKPFDATYKLLTTGDLVDFEDHIPPERANATAQFETTVSPLTSAYKAHKGREPDFTNFAMNKFQSEAFIETLDYIFCSPQWKVEAVEALPTKASVDLQKPFPDKKQPSDHMLISADLQLQ